MTSFYGSSTNDPIAHRQREARENELERRVERYHQTPTILIAPGPAIGRVVIDNEMYLSAGGKCFGPVFDLDSQRMAMAKAELHLAQENMEPRS